MADEYYFVDKSGSQRGPLPLSGITAAARNGEVDGSCLCWNANMSGWTEINAVPAVAAAIKPAPAPRPAPRPAPTPPVRGPPAARPAPTPQRAAAPAPAHYWKELKTPEGQSYYHNSQTNVTTWEKPEELKTEVDRERAGEWYWMPHSVEGFVPARKTGENPTKWMLETEDGQSHNLSKKEYPQLDRLYWVQLNQLQKDLVMLDVMTHPLIIYNLKKRFKQNEIYTNVGTILISLNPYKSLPLYTPSVLNSYINRGSKKLDPHVFEIADAAYANLREKNLGQSIVISGESGAGKTECTKQCLQYIAEIAGSTNTVGPEERILLSNPILEAFGNAKTLRNNNSSRFGKYVEIFFDVRSNICGASNTSYLLEKSRVVFQTPNERNYHIFYQLCVGLDASAKAKYRLADCTSYAYLNQSGCTSIDGVDDADEFSEVQRAMKSLDFTNAEMDDIFCICAAVLHLGNVTFTSTGDRASKVSSPKALEDAAALLQVKREQLEQVCVTRKMQVAGQAPISIGLGADQAKAARDALSKFIYEKLFEWLVQRINKSIGRGSAAKGRSIGILDIFGFEIFKKNSFEQLCINFTNEKLQQFFNQHTFKLEEKCYQDEQIKFSHVSYIDNQPVLDLIENRPQGILPSIDEELRMPKGSDKTWVDKLLNTHRSNQQFSPDRASADCFIVKHYAGAVTYDSSGFLEKNKDQLNDDAYSLLQTSAFKFLASLFPEDQAPSASGGLAKKISLGTKFTRQLGELMQALHATEPHYIRCVKPNPNKAPMEFEGQMVFEQLTYAGVFEAITIRKQGFPFRLTHVEFFQRYKCLFPNTHRWSSNVVENCKTLIAHMGQDLSKVQIGTTKVLYRAEQHRDMELKRNLAVEEVTVYIQKYLRIKAAQLLVDRCKKARDVYAKAIASRDIQQVEDALAHATNVGFKTREHYQCERMLHVAREEQRLQGVLAVLITQNPHDIFDQLLAAVSSADDIEMKGKNADKARQMLAEVLKVRAAIDADAAEQVQRLEEPQMKAVLDRADAIHYTTETIERIRQLLYDTAEDQFVKMQLKAAVKFNDKERVTATTIRLKDLFFESSGDLFKFPKYPRLFPPAAWADLKFLSMDREQLAMGMLRHTKNPIHHTLTQIREDDKTTHKLAKELFKNIMGYMGDKKYADPPILAAELLRTALFHPNQELRSEIYCQIIKQLTGNPSPESTARGWELMTLCLSAFPPPSDVENFVEMYLRSQSNPPSKFVKILHDTLYGGARKVAPTEHEIPQILAQAQGTDAHPHGRGYSANNPSAPVSSGSNAAARPPPGPPPSVAGRPPPPAPRAPPPPPEDTTTEWYYITAAGEQKGPVLQSVLKSDWKSGAVNGECIAWNANLDNWTKCSELSQLMAYLTY